MSRSNSPARRARRCGLTSIPSVAPPTGCRRTDRSRSAIVGSRSTAARFKPGATSFSIRPFRAQAVSNCIKPVILPPGRARLATMPDPTGSTTIANTIGTVRVARAVAQACARARITSGASAPDPPHRFGRARDRPPPARVDPHVAALDPTRLPQSCRKPPRGSAIPDRSAERREIRCAAPLGLLRARGHGPRCRTAKKPRNCRRLMPAPRLRKRNLIGSNDRFDRAETRFAICNMRCWPMSQMGLQMRRTRIEHMSGRSSPNCCRDAAVPR